MLEASRTRRLSQSLSLGSVCTLAEGIHQVRNTRLDDFLNRVEGYLCSVFKGYERVQLLAR